MKKTDRPTTRRCPFPMLAALVGSLTAQPTPAQVSQTANWVGGNVNGSYSERNNWSPQIVPLNNAGTNFTVIVPNDTSLVFDAQSSGAIDALLFDYRSRLTLDAGQSLLVNGATLIRGAIDARGLGSGFTATNAQMELSGFPRFLAEQGAQVTVGASSYYWANYGGNGSATLLSANGLNSLVSLRNASSLQVSYGDGGSWAYSINAANGGQVDLSRTGVIYGPGSDDWLDFNLSSGGNIRLDNLSSISGRARFNVDSTLYTLPLLNRASETYFNPGTNNALRLPSLLSLSSGGMNLAPTSRVEATEWFASDNSAFTIGQGATIFAPKLTTLDTVPLTLGFNASFVASNLVAYRNSDISYVPGRRFFTADLTDIFASRISVSGGATGRVAAVSYDTIEDWRTSPTLFSADGAGSLLDMSAMRTLRVRYGGGSGYTYSATANNGGVIDWSGLETIIGPEQTDDWFKLTVNNGGSIRLPSLREVVRRAWFNIQVPQFDLPLLERADGTAFTLTDGSRINLPNLTHIGANITSSSFGWGFNSTVYAPKLVEFVDSDLSLAPGRILLAPPFTNIFASRLSVSGGSALTVAAVSYDTIDDWRTSPTLFSADGAGSLLDMSAMRTLRVRYGGGSGYTYSATANNGGVIDWSGLETIIGPEQTDDWFKLTVNNGGSIRLPSLREVVRRAWFNIQVPQFDLPLLERADGTAFTLTDGSRINLPNLTHIGANITSSSFGWGFNSTVYAPKLVEFVDSDLSLAPGRILLAPPFTNIFASRLSVSGGSALTVAAVSYDTIDDWRTSPTLFSADGAGSLLDMSAMRTLRVRYGGGSGYTYSATANNGGVIDWSGLETIIGPEQTDDWAAFTASNGGTLKFGNVNAQRQVRFTISGTGSRMEAAGLYLRPVLTLSVTANGLLRVKGDYRYENSDPNNLVIESAFFQMDGTQSQSLEVGGRDAGPSGFSSRNFGFSQLIVGNSNQTSIVRLEDSLNNGGRGPSGEREALYLYGMNGQGLRLLNGSRLLLNSLNAYAAINGQMTRLNSLIPPSSNSVAFDQGTIATTAGPAVTNMTPIGQVLPTVDHVEVTFDMPIAPGSFTAADVVVIGPGQHTGEAVPAPRLSAVRMGQDFQLSARLAPFASCVVERASSVTGPWQPIGAPSAATDGLMTFIDSGALSRPASAGFYRVLLGAGSIQVTNVAPVGGNTWRISFASQSTDGAYTVSIGPNISDAAGLLTAMDQDGDGAAGEPLDDVFRGQFVIDSTAPVIVSAYGLQSGNRVGVSFNEPVSASWATNAGNYLVNGIAPTNAVLLTNGSQVALSVNPLLGVAFTLNVNGIRDPLGNTTNRTFTGQILGMRPADVGSAGSDPRELGSSVPWSAVDFDCVGGGSALWGTSDAYHYLYEERTGDFDVSMRLADVDRKSGSAAELGFVLRESLADNARKVQALVEIGYSGTYSNYYLGVRYSAGGNVPSPYPHIPGVDTTSAWIPNAWIRFRRAGEVFSSYRSTNGIDWIEYGRVTNSFPTTALLGLGTGSDNNNPGQATTGYYREFGELSPSIVTQPQGQTVAQGTNVQFAVTVRGQAPLSYQWYFQSSPLAGGNASQYLITRASSNNIGDYRVVVSNTWGMATSQIAFLWVGTNGKGGFESDVVPRPLGNNAATIADWVQVGRFVAGLDEPVNSDEFARIDCAPRANVIDGTFPLGDGLLTVADWTQAGRYAAGMDPLTEVGGPTTAAPEPAPGRFRLKDAGSRIVWVGNATVGAGQTFEVSVGIDAAGNENAAGFSLIFAPQSLSFVSASLDPVQAGTVLQLNASQAHAGRLGFALARSVGQTMPPGTAPLVRVRFTAAQELGSVPVSFGDQPVLREVVDPSAQVQGTGFRDGMVRIVEPGRLVGAWANGGLALDLSGQAGIPYLLQASSDLHNWAPISTNVLMQGILHLNRVEPGQFNQRFYRLVPQP